MSMFSRIKLMLVVGAFLSLGWLGAAQAAPAGPPFAKACPQGRYMMSAMGWDTSDGTPYQPFALSGYVQLVCTGTRSGTYTGEFFATYPNVDFVFTCYISGGTYTVDATTGAIQSSATVSGTPCFSNTTLSEVGFLSDPNANTISVIETGQAFGDQIRYLWTKSNPQSPVAQY